MHCLPLLVASTTEYTFPLALSLVRHVRNNNNQTMSQLFRSAVINNPVVQEVQETANKVLIHAKKEVHALISKCKPATYCRKRATELALQSAPTKEAYLQILAQNVCYHQWGDGYILPSSERFQMAAYKVQRHFHFADGISGIVVASDDANETPLLIFRGTDPTNIHNLADDLHQHIGEMNCTRYARELEALVEESTLRYGRLHIMGHSYGGTIAQRLTAKFPHFIKRCTYHNAPACGHNVIQEYFRNIIQLPNNLPAPEVWSYRHAKDVASLLGGSPLPTDIGKNFTTGLVADTISSVDAHSFNSLSTGALLFPDMQAHPTVVEIAKQIEKMRKEASKVLPVYTRLRQIFSC